MALVHAKAGGVMGHGEQDASAWHRVETCCRPIHDSRPTSFPIPRTLCLAFALWVVLTGSVSAGDKPAAGSFMAEGPYNNLAVHEQAKYILTRDDNLVTATLGSTKSAVQHAARQVPEILFEIPPGFRPQHAVHLNVEAWPVSGEGVLDTDVAIPHRLQLRVAPDGSARYVDGPGLDAAGYAGYMVSASWSSGNPVGRYVNRELHRDSQYGFSRSGDRVQAVFGTGSSPVQFAARQAVESLFRVPEGYRPTETLLLEVEGRHVDREGNPLTERSRPVRFQVHVGAEGRVFYVDGPELDTVGYLAYRLRAEWATPSDPDFTLSPVVPGADHICLLHPVVQAAVLAALAPGNGSGRDCTSVTRAELANIEKLDLNFALDMAPLQRTDLVDLTGLRSLSLRLPDVLLQFLSTDLLTSQPGLETLELNLYARVFNENLSRYGASLAEQWQQVPALALRLPAVNHPMSYPFYLSPYWIEGGVSTRRIAGLLDDVPGLVKLTLRARIDSCDTPLVVSHPNLKELILHSLTCSIPSSDYLYRLPLLERLTVRGQWWNLPPGFLDRNPRLRFLDIEFTDGNKYRPQDRVGPLPRRLFASNPRLEYLSLNGSVLRVDSLPDDLFLYTTKLREFHVGVFPGVDLAWIPPNVAAQLLAASPLMATTASLRKGRELVFSNLKELELTVVQTAGSPCFAPDTGLRFPNLSDLTLTYWRYPEDADASICAVPNLVYPQLHRLTLVSVPNQVLLIQALRRTPQLTNLFVFTDEVLVLPSSLFAGNPQLKTLKVASREGAVLPNDLLVHTPHLERVELVGSFSDLPEQFLSGSHKVHEVIVNGDRLDTRLPDDQ